MRSSARHDERRERLRDDRGVVPEARGQDARPEHDALGRDRGRAQPDERVRRMPVGVAPRLEVVARPDGVEAEPLGGDREVEEAARVELLSRRLVSESQHPPIIDLFRTVLCDRWAVPIIAPRAPRCRTDRTHPSAAPDTREGHLASSSGEPGERPTATDRATRRGAGLRMPTESPAASSPAGRDRSARAHRVRRRRRPGADAPPGPGTRVPPAGAGVVHHAPRARAPSHDRDHRRARGTLGGHRDRERTDPADDRRRARPRRLLRALRGELGRQRWRARAHPWCPLRRAC